MTTDAAEVSLLALASPPAPGAEPPAEAPGGRGGDDDRAEARRLLARVEFGEGQ